MACVSLVITHERVGGVPVLALTGELDIYTVETFRRAAEPLKDDGAVIIDMGRIELVDSSGLGALVALCQASDGKRTVVLVCAGPAIPRLLELTRLDEHFVSVDDRGAAVAALRERGDRARTPG
jgi:anti-sigma B factor antagonist